MEKKKWYLKVIDQLGIVRFDHKSSSAKRLLALYRKEAFASDGSLFAVFKNATVETNITDEIEYSVACGENL